MNTTACINTIYYIFFIVSFSCPSPCYIGYTCCKTTTLLIFLSSIKHNDIQYSFLTHIDIDMDCKSIYTRATFYISILTVTFCIYILYLSNNNLLYEFS